MAPQKNLYVSRARSAAHGPAGTPSQMPGASPRRKCRGPRPPAYACGGPGRSTAAGMTRPDGRQRPGCSGPGAEVGPVAAVRSNSVIKKNAKGYCIPKTKSIYLDICGYIKPYRKTPKQRGKYDYIRQTGRRGYIIHRVIKLQSCD